MQNLIKIIIVLIINSSFSFAQNNNNQDITVNISNLNSNDGKVFVGLYNTKESFLNKGYKYLSTEIKNHSTMVTFKDVPNGIYAISMYHDENDNDKMDSNFLGIPKEDYGCSNNAKGFMGPPKWEDAKFEVNNKTVIQNIQL
jgi:uncharacterized protein (DUF2141 family)